MEDSAEELEPRGDEGEGEGEVDDPGLTLLLEAVRRARGFDFSGYKRQTLTRRVQRRMQLVGQLSYADYIAYLEARPDEFAHLFNAILINVTSFFRDAPAWQALRVHLTRLVEEKPSSEPIRAWTVGCASGEEAYSLAIVMAELLGLETALKRVKIYATDLDEEALGQARAGRYPLRSMEAVPSELVERYFTASGNSYVFHSDLRRVVIFGRHDLLQNAPISRVDVLTCRNTLMYFNSEAQAKVLKRLHFALANGGIFFLGKAEMLLTHTALFTPLDLKLRLFRRTSPRVQPAAALPPAARADEAQLDALRRAAIDASAVAQLLLDAEGRVALFNPRAASLFALGDEHVGRPFHELEVSYRPAELRSVIDRAKAERRPIAVKAVERPMESGASAYLDIEAAPLASGSSDPFGVHLTFTDCTLVQSLEQRLQKASLQMVAAQEELQSTGEELETTNEELQSTVEELETTNEELQSTNEELETMNEELQSTNEELETLNEELRQRTESLDDANALLSTVFHSLGSGVAVLDATFTVKAWNRTMEELWGVKASDVLGRSVLDLDIGLPTAALRGDLAAAFVGRVGAGDGHVLDCINRRGKAVRCRCHVHVLTESSLPGALLLVQELTQ